MAMEDGPCVGDFPIDTSISSGFPASPIDETGGFPCDCPILSTTFLFRLNWVLPAVGGDGEARCDLGPTFSWIVLGETPRENPWESDDESGDHEKPWKNRRKNGGLMGFCGILFDVI